MMSPLLRTFLQLTGVVAVLLIALWLVAHLIPLILLAAIVAALILGGLFLYRAIRGRAGTPLIR